MNYDRSEALRCETAVDAKQLGKLLFQLLVVVQSVTSSHRYGYRIGNTDAVTWSSQIATGIVTGMFKVACKLN